MLLSPAPSSLSLFTSLFCSVCPSSPLFVSCSSFPLVSSSFCVFPPPVPPASPSSSPSFLSSNLSLQPTFPSSFNFSSSSSSSSLPFKSLSCPVFPSLISACTSDAVGSSCPSVASVFSSSLLTFCSSSTLFSPVSFSIVSFFSLFPSSTLFSPVSFSLFSFFSSPSNSSSFFAISSFFPRLQDSVVHHLYCLAHESS